MEWEIKKQKGNEEFKKKNYTGAIGLYTEVISIDPLQDVLYSNRGLSYMNLNESEKAKIDFARAIELNPKNIKALKRLSYIYIQEGLLREALINLKKIVKIDKEDKSAREEIEECENLIKCKS